MFYANFVSAWTLFTATTVSDINVRNAMIDQIWNFASKNESQTIFPTTFTLDGSGNAVNNIARLARTYLTVTPLLMSPPVPV